MKKPLFYLLICFGFLACNHPDYKTKLIGKWNYVSYEYANKSLDKPLADITLQKPSIVFYQNGNAEIFSSGKVLSKGTYYLEDKIIRYEEVLPNGQKRKIPFLINELNDNELVFQTMDSETLIITAKKEKF
ncbi:hypothetical protein I5M32_06545 [Pedobacter sp. SD-b]|uniref:Lipocalin-like domain-containing protein n=1 Tax=Pedobacter segetis TaxID=2793069 RepID=A0ABS1BIA4_9SPHI|nr:hypothetical protein [Pedobacter segetis]MBK0382618.1 hypothetical protein [Pedobacter segetis]